MFASPILVKIGNSFSQSFFRLICLCVLALASLNVQAKDAEHFIKSAQDLNLASHPTWLRLLYVQAAGHTSAITSPKYFFAENGRESASSELKETIKAYFRPWQEPNKHPRCRFPARYHWLSKQLELPYEEIEIIQNCPGLEKWGMHKKLDSVSLVLVSGYLGNPASSFGHALLKLNMEESRGNNLFDRTVNYGAKVPPGDSIYRYITSGIFGGYKAYFSNQYFATQDLVYSRTEFRDMWEYELALSEEQVRFLMLHVWEVSGREFDYYFFDENCAYRIAQLIDLVDETELAESGVRPWYLPEVLFQNLEKINKEREQQGGTALIQSVKFIPSNQRILYRQMELLTESEIEVVKGILESQAEDHSTWQTLAELPEDRRIILLDTLLAYQQYLLVSRGNKEDKFMLRLKKKILLARLSLPAAQRTRPPEKRLASPAAGNESMILGAGRYDIHDVESGAWLKYTGFSRDLMSRNSLEGNELVIFDAEAYSDSEGLKLRYWDLIRVSNYKPAGFNLSEDKRWNWDIALGARRLPDEDYQAYFSGGAGRSVALNDQWFVYWLANPSLYSTGEHVDLGVKLGLVYLSQSWKLSVIHRSAWDLEGELYKRSSLSLGRPISDEVNVVLGASRENRQNEAKFGLNYYF